MATKLHRCRLMWFKVDRHPCWKVQKALDEQGVDYEVVAGPLRPGRRDALEAVSGQRKYPVIEFKDGVIYREESAEMAVRIRAGKLSGADRAPDASS
jgi:glutaredoxin